MQYFSWILPQLLLGAFLQAAILLRHRISWKRFYLLAILIAIGTGALEILSLTKESIISNIILLYFAYFVISYALVYPHHIMPAISRRTMAGLTVIFWYLCITSGLAATEEYGWIIFAAIILSVTVFVITLIDWPVHKFWRVLCYAWFLLMMIYFSVYHLTLPFLSAILNPATSVYTLQEAGNLILLGMTLFYLAINVLVLVQAVPIRFFDRSASTGYALWEWRVRTSILAGKYSHDSPVVFADTLIVACIFLALLAINRKLSIVPDQILIDILILWTCYFFDSNQKI